MDVALTQSIVSTASVIANRETADAVQVTLLKKALDTQETAAATLLAALPPPPPATEGPLGTQLNTYA